MGTSPWHQKSVSIKSLIARWPHLLVLLVAVFGGAGCHKSDPTPMTPSRTIPDYAGTWKGTYSVTACTNSGVFADVGFCGQVLNTSASATFTFSQSDRSVTGTFQLGSILFTNMSGTVDDD